MSQSFCLPFAPNLFLSYILIFYIRHTLDFSPYHLLQPFSLILQSKPFLILNISPLSFTVDISPYHLLQIFPLIIYYRSFPLSFTIDLSPYHLLQIFPHILQSKPQNFRLIIYYRPFFFKFYSKPFDAIYSRPLPLSFTLLVLSISFTLVLSHTVYSTPFALSFTSVLSIPFTLDLSLYSLLQSF